MAPMAPMCLRFLYLLLYYDPKAPILRLRQALFTKFKKYKLNK